MQRTGRIALVWTTRIVVLTVLLLAATFGVAALADGIGLTVETVMAALVATPSVVLSLVVARRRPTNAVGPVLASVGLVIAATSFWDAYWVVTERRPDLLPAADEVVSLGQGTWMLLFLPLALLTLLFPDGRFLSPRWRGVAVALSVVVVLFVVLAATAPAAYPPPYENAPHALGTLPPWADVATYALLPVFLGLLIACAWSMVLRYRRAADPVVRTQVRWLAVAGLLLPATLLLCWVSYLLLGNADLVIVGLAAQYVCIPLVTAVAMLRHDLYDVDKVLTRTVTYAGLTAVLLLLFTAITVVGGRLLGGDSALVAAVATAVCAAALAPLRSRLQSVVDARVSPLRTTAIVSLDDLRRRVIADEDRPESIEGVLQDALHDPSLRVGLVAPGGKGLVAPSGELFKPTADAAAAPIVVGGREIGTVTSTSLPAELLRDVAHASGLLVEIIRLRVEVGEALEEAERSRSRLLHAGYEERRRLERDLHDGAQQRLVSLGMSLRLAQRHLTDGTVDVDGVLDQSVAEIGTAVAELRTIAHGLRPSSLDDGLGPALAAMMQRVPLPVEVDVVTDPLPDDVATTAFYVASEAVANSVKHAEAYRIDLKVARENGHLQVRVTDDGVGGAAVRAGSGLAELADRVAAAGGQLSVVSPPGRGTVVEAVLPCAS